MVCFFLTWGFCFVYEGPSAAETTYCAFKSAPGVFSITQCYNIWLSFCFQAEMKFKVLEAKHQEEKLKMQQRHDADVEKVRTKTLPAATSCVVVCGWKFSSYPLTSAMFSAERYISISVEGRIFPIKYSYQCTLNRLSLLYAFSLYWEIKHEKSFKLLTNSSSGNKAGRYWRLMKTTWPALRCL